MEVISIKPDLVVTKVYNVLCTKIQNHNQICIDVKNIMMQKLTISVLYIK